MGFRDDSPESNPGSSRMKSGWIALVGGNEFRPDCEVMDRALLGRLGEKPKVLILPTAARENPSLAAANGVRYFRNLGAEAEAANILNRADALNPAWTARLEEGDFLYLTGGDPLYLLDVLQDSPAWETIVKLRQKGRAIGGSSAGAMVLGERTWIPGEGWRKGLGMVPGLAVIPHHASLAARWGAQEMRDSLPKTVLLAGIDEATALAGPPWKVFGTGKVTFYPGSDSLDSARTYSHGQEAFW